MAWVATAISGSALLGAYSSNKAAGAQADAANQSNATQLQMYNQTRQDQMPWLNRGRQGLNLLSDYMGLPQNENSSTQPSSSDSVNSLQGYAPSDRTGSLLRSFSMKDYQEDPGYQFRLQQGMRGINNSAAAHGGALSGGAMKELVDYNSGQASQEYGNAYNRYNQNQSNIYNRLAALSGTGQTQANQIGQNALTTGQNIAQGQQAAGNAKASGYMGQANAVNGGIQNYLTYKGY